MTSLLEMYDRATEAEAKARAEAAGQREHRETLLWVMHRDGASHRQLQEWTGLSHGTVQRMIRAGRASFRQLMGES